VLPSFGEKLKQEREKRKMTLEEISVSTKIGTRMLQALEEDKFNQLPGGIFNKGFVRAYSRCVGLDEDQTVAEYLQASGDTPPVSTEIPVREDGMREQAENITRLEALGDTPPRQLPWGFFAAALLVIALALSLWSHRRQQNARQAMRPIPKVAAQLPVTNENSGNSSSSGSTAPVAAALNREPESSSAAPAPEVAASPKPAASTSSVNSDEFRVVIHAREQSWVSHTVDGEASTSEVLAAGSERAFRGHKEIVVKVGNAGGVDLSFNGKKLDFEGESGQVKTVTFGPLGMVPNAAETPSDQ
jgi:cytoskeleton protein RodZ